MPVEAKLDCCCSCWVTDEDKKGINYIKTDADKIITKILLHLPTRFNSSWRYMSVRLVAAEEDWTTADIIEKYIKKNIQQKT